MHLLGILLLIVGFGITSVSFNKRIRFNALPNPFKFRKKSKFHNLYKEFLKESKDKIMELKNQRKQINSWKYKVTLNNCINKFTKIYTIFDNQNEKIKVFRIEFRNLINSIIDINKKYIDVESNKINDDRVKEKLKEATNVLKKLMKEIDDLGYKVCESDVDGLEAEMNFAKNQWDK